jgi:hypothetical protein
MLMPFVLPSGQQILFRLFMTGMGARSTEDTNDLRHEWTLSVKELSCPSFSTGEKKGNDSLEEVLVFGHPNADFESATCDRSRPASAAASPAEQKDGES